MKKIFAAGIAVYATVNLLLQWRCFSRNSSPGMLWLSVMLELFAIFTAFGFRAGFREWQTARRIRRNGIPAQAVITGFHTETAKLKTYYPVIRFRDSGKLTHELQSAVGMSFVPRKYRKGAKISIAYTENDPPEFVIIPAYFYHAMSVMLVFALFGIPAAVGAVLAVV